jgi:hypothetical protein
VAKVESDWVLARGKRPKRLSMTQRISRARRLPRVTQAAGHVVEPGLALRSSAAPMYNVRPARQAVISSQLQCTRWRKQARDVVRGVVIRLSALGRSGTSRFIRTQSPHT